MKITAIIAMIAGGIAIIVFGFGVHYTHAGISHLWSDGGFFATGFGGFVACFAIVMFAFGGTEIIGITAGEAEDPAQTIRKAVNTVPVRIILFYICTLAVIMAIIPWQTINSDNEPVRPDLREPRIGNGRIDPQHRCHHRGPVRHQQRRFRCGSHDVRDVARRPGSTGDEESLRQRCSVDDVVIMTGALLVGVLLNYLIPDEVFLVIASLATFATIFVWIMILLSQFRSRAQMSADETAALKFPVPLWPVRSDLRDRVPGFCHRVARRHRRYPSCLARRCRMAGSADGRVLQVGETGCQRSGSKWRMTVGV